LGLVDHADGDLARVDRHRAEVRSFLVGEREIKPVLTGDDPEGLPDVVQTPGKDGTAFHRRDQADKAETRHQAVAGFEAAHSCAGRGHPAFADGIDDQFDIGERLPHGLAGPAARQTEAEFGRVDRAAQVGAGPPQPLHHGGVFQCDVAGQGMRAGVCRPALHRDTGLDGDLEPAQAAVVWGVTVPGGVTLHGGVTVPGGGLRVAMEEDGIHEGSLYSRMPATLK